MSSLQWSHHISPISLPFSQLAPPDLLNSLLSTILQSHPVKLSWTGLSVTQLPYFGIPCQHISAHQRLSTRQPPICFPGTPFCPSWKRTCSPNLIQIRQHALLGRLTNRPTDYVEYLPNHGHDPDFPWILLVDYGLGCTASNKHRKRFRPPAHPSDPDTMTNTALEAIASSSGKNCAEVYDD